MSKFKLIIDGRSFILGIGLSLVFFFFVGFKPAPSELVGRYQAVTGEFGHLILDTATGDYIRQYVGSWVQEKFASPEVYEQYHTRRRNNPNLKKKD